MTAKLWFTFVVILASGFSGAALGQKIDGVVVTGEVNKITLCESRDRKLYDLVITLHAKNVGAKRVIISTAHGMTDYYKFARHKFELGFTEYSHLSWATFIREGDPEPIPGSPVMPFKVVAPNEVVAIAVDLRALTQKFEPGTHYLQLVAENWPNYSDKYTEKIREAWKAHGVLWAHSLHSKPISFVVAKDLPETKCS
jgi:hypothetical protein